MRARAPCARHVSHHARTCSRCAKQRQNGAPATCPTAVALVRSASTECGAHAAHTANGTSQCSTTIGKISNVAPVPMKPVCHGHHPTHSRPRGTRPHFFSPKPFAIVTHVCAEVCCASACTHTPERCVITPPHTHWGGSILPSNKLRLTHVLRCARVRRRSADCRQFNIWPRTAPSGPEPTTRVPPRAPCARYVLVYACAICPA